MKNTAIRRITVGTLCVGFMAIAGIASAGDWPLSGLFRPLVHAPVRVVVEDRDCAPRYRESVVIVRDRYERRDRFDRDRHDRDDRHRIWR